MLLCFVLGITGVCLTGDVKISFGDNAKYIEADTVRRTCMGYLLSGLFTSANDVIAVQGEVAWETSCISIFIEMPQSTVQKVTNQLLQVQPHITIHDIVQEYMRNKNIYDSNETVTIMESSLSSNKSESQSKDK